MYILSQILVLISDVFLIISTLCKKKKAVVFFLLMSTILFASHYLCLGGWTGFAIAVIELMFLIVMYILEAKQKTSYNVYLSIATSVLTIIVSILSWAGAISLLPMIAMVVYLITMCFTNLIIVKGGIFVRLALNGIYMLMLKSYLGAGLSVVILIFDIIGIIKDSKKSKVQVSNEQVPGNSKN